MATNFEEITKSPEVLGAFLASLPYLEGPWDTEFQRNFCAGCGQVTCDPICRYQRFRNNPSWWLTLEADPAEQLGTVVIDLDPHGTKAPSVKHGTVTFLYELDNSGKLVHIAAATRPEQREAATQSGGVMLITGDESGPLPPEFVGFIKRRFG